MTRYSRATIAWILFTLTQAFAQPAQNPSQHTFVVNGFQPDSSSPLRLQGDLVGDEAIWQPLASPIQSGTIETIPSGPGFNGAACRKEFRQAQIMAPNGTLTVHSYDTRCEPYNSSGAPSGAYATNGVYIILGGTGKFAGVIGGTGGIQFDANSEGIVFLSLGGVVTLKRPPQAARLLPGAIDGQELPFSPYVPTPREVVAAMLKLANVETNDVVYDLGSGDGRIVIAAAEQFGAHGVGIDLDPKRVQQAAANARESKVEKLVEFRHGDLFKADISRATVVTLYLLPEVTQKLRQKLLRELKPGARIVSHSFDLGDWKPDKEEIVSGRSIYLWTVPQYRAAAGGQ